MLDTATIAVPPTPTATSTSQEWSNYMLFHRIHAEYALAAAAEKQAQAQAATAAAVSGGSLDGVSESTLITIVQTIVGLVAPKP